MYVVGVALEDKENDEQKMNAAQVHKSPGRGNSCWWWRVNICPGLPETELLLGL